MQPDPVQGQLGGPALYFGASADPAESLRDDAALPGQADIDETDRLLGSAARRASNTGDSNSEGGLRSLSDSFC